MSTVNVNLNNFNEIVNGEKTVLLDFYADWCGPCRMVAPVLHEIAEEHPEYVIGKINVDNEPELARQFNVMSIPMLVVMKGGKVAVSSVGAKNKAQILKMLEA
ncbi:MAG: thioredoxin [Clostridia bacterium]|nr:thioredoxin [Clostridia bacterium]MBR4934002.1 thioredoxin [Clostridia bacterium]